MRARRNQSDEKIIVLDQWHLSCDEKTSSSIDRSTDILGRGDDFHVELVYLSERLFVDAILVLGPFATSR